MSDAASMDGGDLGLGRGWKPGAPKYDSDVDEGEEMFKDDTCSTPDYFRSAQNSPDRLVFHDCLDNIGSETSSVTSEIPSSCENLESESARSRDIATAPDLTIGDVGPAEVQIQSSDEEKNNNSPNNDYAYDQELMPQLPPEVGDISLGTSLRQQRQLFDYNVQELFAHTLPNDDENLKVLEKNSKNKGTGVSGKKLDAKLLQKKLVQAETDLQLLKQELEECQQKLESKYKAITILQKQSALCNSENQKSSKHANEMTSRQQEEINRLQFELEYKQTTLMDSQQTWLARFDRMSQENEALMATLEARSSEMRKLHDDKMAMEQERDELLALLDIQERSRYESLKPKGADDQPYVHFSSGELAILGACQCRKQNPDPCNCAYAGANLKRDVAKLQLQIDHQKRQHQESLTTIDAYRRAFDEQLNRNKHLVRQLAESSSSGLSSSSSKAAKFKAAMKWLLQQLNEDLPQVDPNQVNGHTDAISEQVIEDKSELELIMMLVDMVSDKNEALAHQRLASRLLAERSKELEEQLAAFKAQG